MNDLFTNLDMLNDLFFSNAKGASQVRRDIIWEDQDTFDKIQDFIFVACESE